MEKNMKILLWCLIIFIQFFSGSACTKNHATAVLEDISRDTYEKKAREQRSENLGNPSYKEPPTYDQYQKERKKLNSDQEETP